MRRRHFSGLVVLVMLIGVLLSPGFCVKKVEAEPQVTIVSFKDPAFYTARGYRILGEVLNSGDTALEVFPSATFYDSNGTVMGTERGISRIENLLPGRKSPFEIPINEVNPSAADHYSLNVSFVPTDPRRIGLEILSHRSYINEAEGSLSVVGELACISGSAYHIDVIATFYDETGNIVDFSATIYNSRSVLDEGETIQISRATWGGKIENITSYTLTAEAYSGGEVKEEKEGVVDHTHPIVTLLSPTNTTTYQTDPQLHFNVSEPTSWMGYSIDEQNNVTLTENTSNLTGLSNGSHSLTVFARDKGGNTGLSKTVSFSINKSSETEPEPNDSNQEPIDPELEPEDSNQAPMETEPEPDDSEQTPVDPEPEPDDSNKVPIDIPRILAVIGVGSATILLIYIIIRRQKIKGTI